MNFNQQKEERVKRKKPKAGQFKINTDGAWSSHTKEVGIGYIMRDHKRKALIATIAHHTNPSPLFFELLAIKSAMGFIHSSKGREEEIIIEANSLKAIQMITRMIKHPLAEVHVIL